MKLEPITQSKVGQKEKDKYCMLIHTYMGFRKMALMTLLAGQQRKHRHKEQNFVLSGRRRGWDDLKE